MQEKLVALLKRELGKPAINESSLQSEIADITGRKTTVSRSGKNLEIKIDVPWLAKPLAKSALAPEKIQTLLADSGTPCSCSKTGDGIDISLDRPDIAKIRVLLV